MSEPTAGDEEMSLARIVKEKCLASDIPGFLVEFSAEECEVAGGFIEDAITVVDAMGSVDEEV